MKYTLPIIIIILIIGGLYTALSNINSTSNLHKNKRLACQNETITFEKINKQHPIKSGIELLESGNYTINTTIDYSKYMKSKLINILSEQQATERLNSIIKKNVVSNLSKDKKLQIKFYIYENDKEDKRKKGDKCKLYAGYVMLEFRLDNRLLYKIQTDYMQNDISDMSERIQCAITSFTSLK